MAATWQFVDSIASSPTVRLDLNSPAGGLMVGDDFDLSPPPMRRAVVSNMLVDGSIIPASSYDNRVIKLPVQLLKADGDTAATALQQLARELDRPNNILRVQLPSMTSPVFFRTFSAGDYAWSVPKMLARESRATLTLPAEPFGLGLRVTLSPVTVNNDPAAGSNGCFWDIAGVLGDVETPAVLSFAGNQAVVGGVSGSSTSRQTMIATRRRGTPANAPFVLQAEAMTQSTDTTIQANDAAMSGAGSNYSRCTFAVQTGLTGRIGKSNFPGSVSTDSRGTYRVLVRYRKSVASDVITTRLWWSGPGGASFVFTDLVTLPTDTNATNIRYADMGLISLPLAPDPVVDGFSGVEVPVGSLFYLQVDARRVSGTGTIDFDHVLLMPADDHLAIIGWPINFTTPDTVVVDGAVGVCYGLTAGGITAMPSATVVGSFPMLSPSVTNRVYFVRDAGYTTAATDAITGSTAITLSYWPRYLSIRPATT